MASELYTYEAKGKHLERHRVPDNKLEVYSDLKISKATPETVMDLVSFNCIGQEIPFILFKQKATSKLTGSTTPQKIEIFIDREAGR